MNKYDYLSVSLARKVLLGMRGGNVITTLTSNEGLYGGNHHQVDSYLAVVAKVWSAAETCSQIGDVHFLDAIHYSIVTFSSGGTISRMA